MYELGEELQNEMKQLTQPRAGRIQLGVADDVERPLAVRLVRHLLRGGPTARRRMVTLCTGSHENLLTQLREQSLDAVLSDQPMYSAGLETLGTTEMPVSLVVPKAVKPRGLDAFEASSEKIAKQLRASGVGLIMPSARLRFRGEIDRFLSSSRLSLPVVFESDNLASVVRAVLEGVGAAFLPLPYVEDSVQREQVVPLGPPHGLWRHPLHLFALPESATTTMAESLRAAFVSLDREN
jgi:DNA-binding transcriptional LysR family regulator